MRLQVRGARRCKFDDFWPLPPMTSVCPPGCSHACSQAASSREVRISLSLAESFNGCTSSPISKVLITSAMRPNALAFAAHRFVGCPRPWPVSLTLRRAASTKHPKGFVSPSTEELAELRERVQEFASKPYVSDLLISSLSS